MKFTKKSLGQNFLIDQNIIRKITNLTKINNRNIIEIGPGEGALTNEIIKNNPKSLSLIEKDSELVKRLKSKYSEVKFINIYHDDILDFDLQKLNKKDSVIFGNLPYNISSQILIKILKFNEWPPKFKDIIFMFQKEVGEKIYSKFPSSKYGRLSIITKYRLNIVKKFFVSPNCFFPKPKINSVVIHFIPKIQKYYKIKNLKNLEEITNIFFSNKRKMINKNIKKILNKNEIKELKNLDTTCRPSELKPEIFYKITELFEKKH